MAIPVLVVDDEPDVEVPFRQQLRREVRVGIARCPIPAGRPPLSTDPRACRA